MDMIRPKGGLGMLQGTCEKSRGVLGRVGLRMARGAYFLLAY